MLLDSSWNLGEVVSEVVVIESTGPFLPKQSHSIGSLHAKLGQDEPGHKSRAIQSHATVSKDLLTVSCQTRAEFGNCMQLIQIRQILVVDGEKDIKHVIWHRGNSEVEITFKVDYDGDSLILDRLPLIDRRGKIDTFAFVQGYEIHRVIPLQPR